MGIFYNFKIVFGRDNHVLIFLGKQREGKKVSSALRKSLYIYRQGLCVMNDDLVPEALSSNLEQEDDFGCLK